jgi:hypothetical protein
MFYAMDENGCITCQDPKREAYAYMAYVQKVLGLATSLVVKGGRFIVAAQGLLTMTFTPEEA